VNYFESIGKIGKNVRALIISNVLVSIGTGAFFVLFNIYLKALGIKGGEIGIINGAMSLGTGVFAYFAGIISDEIGRKRSFLVSSIIISFFFFLISFSRNTLILTISAFGVGTGNALFLVSGHPFILENTGDSERTHAYSLIMASLFFGEFIGTLVGGFLPSLFGGGARAMQLSLFTASFLIAGGAIPIIFIKERWVRRAERSVLSKLVFPFAVLAKYKDKLNIVLTFVGAQVLIGLGAGCVVPFFNLYFKERFHMQVSMIGIIFSAGSIVIMLGTLLAPIFRKRFGKLKGFVIIQSLSLPFVLLLAFTRKVWVAVVSYLTRATLMNMAVPIETQLYMESVPEEARASMSSFMEIGWNLSWTVAAPFAGFIMQRKGFTPLFLIMFVFYICGISLLYFSLRGKVNE
jgi:MFS family permease